MAACFLDLFGQLIMTILAGERLQSVRFDGFRGYAVTFVQTDPLFTLDLSSHSHPFFTGKQKFVDSEGRVERFQKKFGRTAKTNE